MDIRSILFSFEGRVNRKIWWTSSVVGGIMMTICTYGDLSARAKGQNSFWTVITIAIIAWPTLAIQTKRWHDRKKSGFWFLIGLIPYVGALWAIIELGFLGPVEEDNRF